MSSIEIDLSLWPIAITNVPPEIREDALAVYLDAFIKDVLGRRERFVSLVDASRIESAPSAKVRRAIADWETEHAELGNRLNCGIAIVTTSALVRGAMTAINWIVPPMVPTTYVATRREGIQWACQRLEAHGLKVPSHVAARI